MGFQDAVRSGFQNYANFKDRSGRSEYWYWYLFTMAALVVSAIVDAIIGSYPLIYVLVVLALLLPGFAVSIRRLHDLDKSGWTLLIGFIPFGGLYLLYLYVKAGDDGPNSYGLESLPPPA